MVHIIGDWYLTTDTYCFVLMCDTHKVDREGKRIYKDRTYHDSIENAIKWINKCYQKELTEVKDMSLTEYLAECIKMTNALEDVLDRVHKEISINGRK